MALVVGITGGIGSGKSALTNYLEARGITVVDADLAARVVVEPGQPALEAIAAHFGRDILLTDGGLDRAALRKRVFDDPGERRWLERLTHPLIGEEIERQLAASTSAYTVLSSPLLLEGEQSRWTDLVVVVDVPVETQVARTMARDDNDEAQVRRIIAAQMERDQRLDRADIIIDNSGTLADLEEQAAELHKELLARAELG
ncbi:dephospho-CoA kinase [Parahaliea mediterranea]|uniref:Dephospho-CoA kinase n=1 Tax=Parahaliea mediterranea TaxID=651086 RepID=A0A939IKF0_9GAMM|nr:dephospho-CoA kinase [Parahaliea mediterranea]MBN7795390.1 dephospho-CoA kinase [Parahaliea mediterranea]